MERELKHGLASTYNNYKCRCEECREAWRVYAKKYARDYYYRNLETERQKRRDYWTKQLEIDPVGTKEKQRVSKIKYEAKKRNMIQ